MLPLIPVWTWFAQNAMPWFGKAMERFMRFLFELLGPYAKIAIYGSMFATAWVTLLSWAVIHLNASLARFLTAELPTVTSSMLAYYGFFNRFLPLSEAFAGTILMFHLWLGITLFRWVKSIIPSLSN